MGRSKFPGKPSKSINRKRISVLQLDPNTTTTTTASAANAAGTASVAAGSASSTANSHTAATGAATTTTTAAANNSNSNAATTNANAEDEEEQKKTEENVNTDSVEYEKRKNGKKEDDDDEDHYAGGSNGGGGGGRQENGGSSSSGQGGGSGGASGSGLLRQMNGRGSNPSSQQHQQNNTNSLQQKSDKIENLSNNTKKELQETNHKIAAATTTTSTTINSPKDVKKHINTGLINFSKRPCKKFKNLNINKPEVMLPSSSKLKLQQQQQENITITSTSPSSTSSTTPASTTLNSFPTELPTTNNDILTASSSTSSNTSSLVSTSIPATLNSPTADRLASTTLSSCNINEYHKSNNNHNHNSTIDQHKINNQQQQPKQLNTNNNNDLQNNDHNEDLNNDNVDNVDVENSSLTFPTTTSSSTTTPTTTSSATIQLELMKKCQKSQTDNSAASPSASTATTAVQTNLISETFKDNNTNDDNKKDDNNKNIIKTNPSNSNNITPINSPSRTMEHLSSISSSPTSTAATNTTMAASLNTNSNSSSSTSSDKKQKKTVTFKNVLETSDDKSAVKKFYNPDNRKPLVSIIKKECLNRPLMYTRNSECIVRPSRLTEILKNNSNIDKLNSLKFRSHHTSSSETGSVLAGPLSRVFGAPSEEEDNKQKQSIINFRLTKEQSDVDEEDEEEEGEDEQDDEEDEDEEEEGEEEGEEEDEEDDEEEAEEEDEGEQQETTEANAFKLKTDLEPLNKRKSKANSEDEEEEQQMIVDKHFVLPKRSSRSSRVIKPNSRLIEDGVICKKSVLKTSSSTATVNANLLAKEDKTQQQPNYFGLGDYNAKDCNGLTGLKTAKDSLIESAKLSTPFSSNASSSSNVFSNFASSSTVTSASSSNINSSSSLKPSSFVLRQPRLQFESLTNNSFTSPASTLTTPATTTSDRSNNPSSVSVAAAAALSASLPKSLQQAISSSAASAAGLSSSKALLSPTFSLNGTSAVKNNIQTTAVSSTSSSAYQCAVCSSVINTKSLPQAYKYVEPSCEHCRKFISKIAKKSLAMKNSTTMKTIQLQCKADGNCVILPLNNKAGHLKNFKKVYKERCGYCWLKKCLHTLQLPKVRLNAVLPILSNATTSTNNNSSSSKTTLQDSKSKKELNEEISKSTGAIKWKPLAEPLLTTASTSNISSSNSLTESLKLNLKSNPLVENNVTFGSVPLLRPAILEKPLFLKSPLDTKQEKLDKKPLDVLKDVKTEIIMQETLTTTAPVLKTSTKKKDKSGDKERKEVRVKEMLSPKTESDTKTKDVKEKLESVASELKEAKHEETTQTASTPTSLAATVSSPNQSTAVAAISNTTQTAQSTNTASVPADKRQRIDLKGPRVKHVCRSASIVLGQPLAMFGEEGEETSVLTEEQLQQSLEQQKAEETKLTLTDENDNCASCKTQQLTNEDNSITAEPPLKTAKIEKVEPASKALVPVSKLSQRPHHYNTQLTAYKKQINSQINPAMMPPRARKEPQMKCKLLISIDFWENYDPAEVCQTGFGLIVTETVAQRALCFLCGSAGQESLIFCSCCCEPYHQYCVQDEFNLKHGSLDETLLLNESCLSVTGLSSNANTAIAKLNWLCPRCTVCYTCNMSSGAKVKCQKCQKNYHSTCLGTSKRLLGADRPLICVNCLKCRSCSTTKVTKFVGNLPMCTNCFKLRKKGNYCPVCQKCYDDQDFDLKMMECGDCHQWVHAKCETLTDEQYNLLSTLPESIEFICKRCSRKSQDAKQRACEWREAVKEEFKSSLMSVLKLLSKSRQACALLKLSPRKQLKCACGSNSNSTASVNKYQPKALQFSSANQMNANNEQDPLSSSSNNIDIYEFDDRERDQLTLNPASIEMQTKKCLCQQQMNAQQSHLSLVEIKHKISNGSYVSLAEFNYDMNLVIQQANCDDLVIVYKEILSEQFPWFQNETQACTDALEEDMYESAGGAYGLNSSIDSESDYNMDCLPSQQDQQDDHDRSALLSELPQDLEDQLYNIKNRTDSRICLFCRRTGEGMPGEESRLLYCGHDCWVHTNCALWSAEVFEEIDGSLQNVHSAVARGRMIKCSVCGNRGATVGCNVKSCGEHYHYPCARAKNCAFLADKSMYCPQHASTLNSNKISLETQFEVTRPVYVELERKRKKLVEPSKVQFHIGSLEVKQLGHILPRFSDNYECLVPVNFLCSRLYWSSKEPWKIVEYTVRTYIYNATSSSLSNGAIDLGKNFTVDHSQNNAALIQLGLTQIQQWHLSLAKGDYETSEEYDYINNFSQHTNSQESNANNEEEPQTNADLLPPEIKDVIFEDLPGDLLEGISMLDIFTKCMNYEDMAQGEQSKDGVTNQQMSDEDTMNSIGAFTKQLTAELNSNWSSNANHNHIEDALLSNNTTAKAAAVTAAQAVKLQKLKKSSSPVIQSEVNAKNAIKRRKISENMLMSLNNHQRSQNKKEESSVNRRLNMETGNKRTFTWSAEKRYNLDSSQSESKIKLMQVDGVDDSITEYRFITQDNTQAAVKCERCQCTYRNIESFQRHLNNCEPLSSSTSESESEHNSHTPEVTQSQTQALTLEQLQELNNKLQQQQQQRSNQMPFIQSIPTQTLNQLQGLQTANILQGVQLQGVQNLQNLQNLHNIQQLTQPQTLGGNFFISTTQPEMNQASTDLQLYANTLQGLTANLNGTFTLQPTATQFANAPQLQQNSQPQLIAVSTNPDGTQQIIQLPSAATPTQSVTPTATYQTLQATNTDKKIVLPVTQGKPLKTMATKAAQQAAAKNKLKATTVVKPIQSKINNTTTTTTTNHLNTAQTVNATQLLNQQLLQQLQQQAQQQTNTQPQLLFQAAQPQQQQPQIIMQQPQNIISFVTTTNDGTQQPQLQYVTLPTAPQQQTEFKPQTQASLFTTANTQPLMQSAYLQTDATGNLVLTNAPPQTAAPLQLITTPQGPQVIGTLIQPQTLQLQGGNVITTTTTATAEGGIPQQGAPQAQQQQVIISGNPAAGANGLEMLTAATTPQVILATTTQPMYYGLETIVQNTVMSSQQFVSTAMPGVLSQNASFSATTTQVFQASKIEPLVDIPAGYVLINNVDANNALMQTQQATNAAATSVAQQQANQNTFIQAALQQQAQALAEQQQQQQQQQNVFRLQTPPVTTAAASFLPTQPQIMVTQQTPTATPAPTAAQFVEPCNNAGQNVHLVSAKVAPVAQVKRNKTSTPVATVTKVQPQVVNKVVPNVVQVQNNQTQQQQQQPQKIKLHTTHTAKPLINTQTVNTVNNLIQQQQQQQTQSIIPATITVTPQIQNTNPQNDLNKNLMTTATTTSAATVTLNTTTIAASGGNKKTNMIRPLHKLEVKPKVMKTATATVVTKSTNNTANVCNISQPLTQINTPAVTNSLPNNNKMMVLKPQQQQHQQMTETLQSNLVNSNNNTNNNITTIPEETATIIPLNNLTSETTESTEFMNIQHVTNNHQQHYNVADALLLDESSQMPQQTLSHCSFSNTTNNYEAASSTPTAAAANNAGAHNNTDSVSNILPTIQRMPQYTNINIVNPLQQYSSTNTLTTSSSTTTTTITRPTNRVLPMQQRQYEQHSQQTTSCSTTSSTSSAAAGTHVNGSSQFTHTTTTTNSQISQNLSNTINTIESSQHSTLKTNINKIAYEAEVKQMLLHSPQPHQEQQQNNLNSQLQHQQQMQAQHVLHMQQQNMQHSITKTSPPPLSYDITEKNQDPTPKMCLHDLNYVHNNLTDFVTPSTPEQCLITDPKFPPEGEVILGSDCCENEEEALSSANNEEEEEDQTQEEEEDDGFSLKMPSADGSDNLSMDSDEPAVKEKISKILDNLTNEDCNDSLNTSTTLEAQVEMACNNQYLNATLNTENIENNHQNITVNQGSNNESQQLAPQDANDYYTATTEETSAFIAAHLAAENMKEQQVNNDNYSNNMMEQQLVCNTKMQEQVESTLNTNYIQNCTPATDLNNLQQSTNSTNNLSAPLTMSANQAPQPPHRDPKRVSGPHLLYEIQSEDGFTYKSSSITEVWEKVFEAVQVARKANGLAPLPEGPLADMSGVQMIGLKTNALKYLIEQLPGVEKCHKYTPKYHKRNSNTSASHTTTSSSLSSSSSMSGNASVAASLDTDSNSMDYASDQEDLVENPYDCARCEPYSKRSEYDMFSWLASRHRKQPVQVFVQPSDNELVPRRGTGSNLPMAMKYRTLKETYKDYVGVFRSHIHGRGLYCTKDIEAGEMVIEYAGELIRSTLTDQRERYYNSRGIGCYMFKIDDHLVVDATMRGNAARFINHSCEPNCYSKVVDILGHKHIIIFALRRIVQGEELTYDYKFPFEDEKIPCSCGSKRCRKYLN